jgi:hypothetical protein
MNEEVPNSVQIPNLVSHRGNVRHNEKRDDTCISIYVRPTYRCRKPAGKDSDLRTFGGKKQCACITLGSPPFTDQYAPFHLYLYEYEGATDDDKPLSCCVCVSYNDIRWSLSYYNTDMYTCIHIICLVNASVIRSNGRTCSILVRV